MENIVFFVSSLNSGGIENYLLRFLKVYHQKFDRIIIFCTSGKEGQLDIEYDIIPNVEIYRKRLGFFDILGYRSLIYFYMDNKITTVCDFSGNFAGLKLKMAKRAGVKRRIVQYRGSTDHFKMDPFRSVYNNWVKYLTYNYATTILSNSKAAFDYFFPHRWKNDKRFKVVYNGIDAKEFIKKYDNNLREEFGIPKEAFVVGHTGRYNEAKNHKIIMEVAKELITEHENIYFILCGNGVKYNLQKQLLKDNELKKILLFENRRDISLFLNTMNCYFFPSITEGQPNALIEAMISGLPIVVSDIEPIRETTPIVAHEYFKKPSDKSGFKTLIEKVYLSKGFANKLIYKNWALKNFDYKEKFEELYKYLN